MAQVLYTSGQNHLLYVCWRFLSLKVPGKGAPPPCSPNRVPMERDALSPDPMVYSFIYICQSPQLRSPSTKWGKTYSQHPRSHTQMKGLHTVGWAWFPKGIVTTLPSLPQCLLAAFSIIPCTLAWVDQSPISQHVS